MLKVPPDINSLLMCQVTEALRTKAETGGRNHPSLMRSLEQCRVMVLQGRAGYTTGSRAEDGNRLETLLWLPAARGLPRPPPRRLPSAIPRHPRSIPAASRPSGMLRVPAAAAAAAASAQRLAVPGCKVWGVSSHYVESTRKTAEIQRKSRLPWFASSPPAEGEAALEVKPVLVKSLPWSQSALSSSPHP